MSNTDAMQYIQYIIDAYNACHRDEDVVYIPISDMDLQALKTAITILDNQRLTYRSKEWREVYERGWKEGRQKLMQVMEREAAK